MPAMTSPPTRRRPWLLAALACAGLAKAAPAPAMRFDGSDWQLRQGMPNNYDFERVPQAGADDPAEHLVIVLIDRVTPFFGAPELASAMLQEQRQTGTVLKAWTQPAATPGAKDYLSVGRSDNGVTHAVSIGVQRVTTTPEGFPEVLVFAHTFKANTKEAAIQRWLAVDGARIERALAGWHEVPAPADLLAMAREKAAKAP